MSKVHWARKMREKEREKKSELGKNRGDKKISE